jgi:hypothetical protein
MSQPIANLRSRVWKAFLCALRIALYPIQLEAKLIAAISGEGRRYRKTRKFFDGRPALSERDFIRMARVAPENARIWLILRHVIAEFCQLPDSAIYPLDQLSDLRMMMVPGSSAPWYAIAPDWFEVINRAEELLGVNVPFEEFDESWLLRSKEATQTLGLFSEVVTTVIRNHYDGSRFVDHY